MSARVDRLLLVLGVLVLWAAASRWLGPIVMAGPGDTLLRSAAMLTASSFWVHAAATGRAFALAVAISWGGGLLLGLILGSQRTATEVADPLLGALYSIPKITLYPIILLIFGLGISAKVAFGAIHGIFPVTIFAMGAVRNVNPLFVKTARSLNMSRAATITTILLPAALPEILTGLRIGFAAALLGTLVGELFASDAGLGFMLMRSIGNQDIPAVMALTLLIFLAAVAANATLSWVEARLEPR
jgi:NitT/TauT family transport system permease protein